MGDSWIPRTSSIRSWKDDFPDKDWDERCRMLLVCRILCLVWATFCSPVHTVHEQAHVDINGCHNPAKEKAVYEK